MSSLSSAISSSSSPSFLSGKYSSSSLSLSTTLPFFRLAVNVVSESSSSLSA
ncbi:hypothetical protein AWRI1631_43180 [Saccharomyces cerevisiae AWRI1631]|uniref:Uncharacterized protein n=1 Tax=Saccharomyces cerevisiae (strain AWRI1631) TaxID=545124 RepID=B5VFZ6_YEAS6|nr:hypothetical protein AWRI1631_43180 [Saccharomyces cerevisiae AWRI1631]